jgi:methyl-accepting chemotaxis protein
MTLLKQKFSWQVSIISIICIIFVYGTGFIGLKLFDSLSVSIEKNIRDLKDNNLRIIKKTSAQAAKDFELGINQIRQEASKKLNDIKIFILYVSIACISVLILVLLFAYFYLKRTIKGMVQHVADGLQKGSTIVSYSSRITFLHPVIQAFNNLIDMSNRLRKILSIVPVPIIELDNDYCVKFINDTGLDLLKMERNDVLNQKCKEIIRSNKCEDDNCPCKHASQTRNVISVETRIHVSENDQDIPVDFTVVPFEINENDRGSIISLTDLSMMVNIVDEVKRITEQLNTTSDLLSQMSAEIKTSTEDIVTMSEQSASSIASMATLGEEMAANVSSQADSVQNMTGSLKNVAKNTEKANQISRDANTKTSEVNAKMQALVEASEQIGKVITVINDIADRTDLLALNAAIEAEGAGIAGKGFAVVADEVQKLAKQSADATDEIAQEIENIQTSTQDAVQAMEQISTIIDEIAEINETNASAVQEQTQTATSISEHTNQNVQAGHTVATSANDALNLINSIAVKIRQTAGQAESTNNASQDLAYMASELMNTINQLNL